MTQLHFPCIPAVERSPWVTLGLAHEEAAMTWLRLDVETPTDEKLFALPVATRYLWVCLLALAKKLHWDSGDPTIRNHSAQTLAARFNLGKPKGVQDSLKELATTEPRPLIYIQSDGSILIPNFVKHQGEHDPIAKRKRWADQKKKQRHHKPVSSSMSCADNSESPQESPLRVHAMSSGKEVEVERRRKNVDLSDHHEGDNAPSVDNPAIESHASEGNPAFAEAVNNALDAAKAASLRAAEQKRGEP